MVSDAHKHFVLQVRRGLITDGLFSRIRHPNYLGEMMLYASFALLAQHWAPWLVLLWVWAGVFLPNILAKEASMARYPEWAAYRARTGLLLPRLWPARRAPPARDPGVEHARGPAAPEPPGAGPRRSASVSFTPAAVSPSE
jgi:hypothetical protein